MGHTLAPEPVLPLAYLYPFFCGVGQEELLPARNIHLPLLVQQQESSELFSSFGRDKEQNSNSRILEQGYDNNNFQPMLQ